MDTAAHIVDPGTSSLRLVVSGDLLSTNAESVRSRFFSALQDPAARGIHRIEIDLRRASMVDSVGLNLLVSVIRAAKNAGAETQLRVSNSNVLRTFQFTRLHLHAEVRFEPLAG